MESRMPLTGLRLVALAVCAASATACDSSPTEELGGPAILSVQITDAPGDVVAVWASFEEMYFQGTPEGRMAVQSESSGLIELTALVGSTQELVSGLELTPGRYRELRMVLTSAVLETANDGVFAFGGAAHPEGLPVTGELRCPSCSSSGLKAKLAGGEVELAPGQQVLLLDFDVSQSFGRQAGGSDAWVMHPVVNGVVYMGASAEAGPSITGTVTLGEDTGGQPVTIPACPADQPRTLAEFVPTATAAALRDGDGAAIMKSGATEDDGSFTIPSVEPDTWAMGFMSEVVYGDKKLVLEATAEPAEVTVGETGASGVAYTVTSATCEDAVSGLNGNPTTATVFLTDAPGDVRALWVDVSSVYAQGGPAGRHVLLSEATGLIEVSALTSSVQEIASQAVLPAGAYTQMRMVLKGAVLETASGDVLVFGEASPPGGLSATGMLGCPSCSDSGIKIKTARGGMQILDGEHNAVVLDLDVQQSLEVHGPDWHLGPVVHAVRTSLGDGSDTVDPGAAAGVLVGGVGSDVPIPACPIDVPRSVADFVPEIAAQSVVDNAGDAMVRTGSVDAVTGTFTIDFLETDTYRLGYARTVSMDGWDLEFQAIAEPGSVHVERGAPAATANYRITSATCTRKAQGG